MKIRPFFLIFIIIGSILLGGFIEKFRSIIYRNQRISMAGQTLADLSFFLTQEYETKGSYPDSIKGVKIPPRFGDFSQSVLDNVVYLKTKEGFAAFVGMPHVSYVISGESPVFK